MLLSKEFSVIYLPFEPVPYKHISLSLKDITTERGAFNATDY